MEMVYRDIALEKGREKGNREHIMQWYVEFIIFLFIHIMFCVVCCLVNFSYLVMAMFEKMVKKNIFLVSIAINGGCASLSKA
jgi:hypothetical protein